MISVIVSKEDIFENKISVTDKNDINHLKNSFRIKLGEEIRAVDGKYEYICQVVSIDKKNIELKILTKHDDAYSKDIIIVAAIGILKNEKMDLTIQKLTEIGIDQVIPIITKRSVVKLSEKKEKWDVIVKEATKQCQAIKLMEITNPQYLKNINFKEYDLAIVPYEYESVNSLRYILNKQENKPKKILYIIGPEGGFEEEEIEFLTNNGVIPVSLGKRILRAETASIIVGGILVNEF